MSSNSEQSSPIEVAEKRRPVKVAQCVFNALLYGAYAYASARFALHASGASLFLLGSMALVSFVWSLFWLRNLYCICHGDNAEYIFTPLEKRESFMRIFFDRFCCTSIAVSVTAVSICLLCIMGAPSFAMIGTMLLVNIAAWRGTYQSWTHDRTYKKEPKVKFASEEAIERAKLLKNAQRVPVTIGASGERPAGHWWTDTQLREENNSSIGR